MTQDWFRRTTWTAEDRAAFLARNRRSRGDWSKAQYVRIQALTLYETGTPDLVRSALDLLVTEYFPLYSTAIDASAALCTAGECCESLERVEDSIAYYRRALTREREQPGSKSAASFKLAKLAVELGRHDLLPEALAGLDAFGHSAFPWHAYVSNGARAAFASAKVTFLLPVRLRVPRWPQHRSPITASDTAGAA